MRYKELCGLYVQLVTKAAESEVTYGIVKDGLMKMFEMVDGRLQSKESTEQHSNVRLQDEELDQYTDGTTRLLNQNELQMSENNTLGVKGIKIKKKTVSGKRLRDDLEKVSRKKN